MSNLARRITSANGGNTIRVEVKRVHLPRHERRREHRRVRREAKHVAAFAVEHGCEVRRGMGGAYCIHMPPVAASAVLATTTPADANQHIDKTTSQLPDDSHKGWARLERDLMSLPVIPDDGSDIGDRWDGLS